MRVLSPWTSAVVSVTGVVASVALLTSHSFAQQGPQDIADSALQQIAEITAMKQALTAAQQKIDSNLVFTAKAANGDLAFTAVSDAPGIVATDPAASVTVEIYGTITASLVDAIASANGVVSEQSEEEGMILASLPLGAIESVAAHPDVKSIQSAARVRLSSGALTSQGYISHAANQVFKM